MPPAAGPPGLGVGGNGVRFVVKLPRTAAKAGLAGPAGGAPLANPNAFVTPTPLTTPTPMPTMTPAPGSPTLGGTSTPTIGGIASIKFVVTPVGQRSLPPTVLPIGSGQNCASAGVTMQCTLIEPLSPGNYTTTVAVYGGANGAGPVLGPVQTIAFSVSAQKQNTLPMAIGGIPAAISVAGASFAVHPAANNGFTIYSENAQPFIAMVQDATGDTIVGPGSPTFGITSGASTGGAVASDGPVAAGAEYAFDRSAGDAIDGEHHRYGAVRGSNVLPSGCDMQHDVPGCKRPADAVRRELHGQLQQQIVRRRTGQRDDVRTAVYGSADGDDSKRRRAADRAVDRRIAQSVRRQCVRR